MMDALMEELVAHQAAAFLRGQEQPAPTAAAAEPTPPASGGKRGHEGG